MRIPLLLAALLLVASGCDSSDDDLVLDAGYYVGSWTLVSISDGNGDQTAAVGLALDDLDITFQQNGAFRLDADFNAAVNQGGQADIATTGTYQAQPSVPSLILQAQGLAATLQASSATDNRVRLTAPAVIVNQLLQGLPFQFQGDTSVTLARQ